MTKNFYDLRTHPANQAKTKSAVYCRRMSRKIAIHRNGLIPHNHHLTHSDAWEGHLLNINILFSDCLMKFLN